MGIFNIHNPWTFTFGILGNIISFLVYLAPVTTFYRVYRKKSTEGFHSLPYLVALFSSMLWLYYALVKTNAMLLITINSFGCVIEIIYIIIFIIYAPTQAKKLTIKLFGVMDVGAFGMIVVITRLAVAHSYQVQVLGWICVAVSVSVFAAPLSVVAQVIKTRSVEYMPFPLSFFLTLSAIMWFAYGMFLNDICIAIPNVLGFILGFIQMALYGMYRKNKTSTSSDVEGHQDNNKKTNPRHHVTNITTVALSSCDQVYPVDLDCDEEDQNTTLEIVLADLHSDHTSSPI